MKLLVVGATGILRPAAATLAAEGHDVTGISRTSHDVPAGVRPMIVDATDAFALALALGDDTWDGAIVYAPALSTRSLSVLRAAVSSTVLTVLTSDAARPGAPDPIRSADTLVLGWVPGERRWHTAAEVSAAALDAFERRQSRLLGVVQPWSDRP